jgi:hypothetical protein
MPGVAECRPGSRIGNHIADRKQDADIEQHQPPARQRIVEFLDPVPFMANGMDAGGLVEAPAVVGPTFIMIIRHRYHPRRSSWRLPVPLPCTRPERPEAQDEEHHAHRRQPPAVDERAHRVISRARVHRPFSLASTSWAAGAFTSTSSQHLQVSDQRIHFGDLLGVAVKVAGLRLGIARLKVGGIRIRIGLGLQVVVRLGDIVLGIGNPGPIERLQRSCPRR